MRRGGRRVGQHLPELSGIAPELLRILRRIAAQAEHLAGPHIQCHEGPPLIRKRAVGRFLKGADHAEPQRFAAHRFRPAKPAGHQDALATVHHPVQIPVGTDQGRVVDAFDPVLPDQVSRGRRDELLEQQLRRRDFSDVPEEVRGRLTEGVVPCRNELHPDSREFAAAGFEERRLGERNPGAHHRRTAGRPRLEAGTVLVLHREKPQLLELAESRFVGKQRERRRAPSEDLPTPIDHQSAGSAATLGLEIVVPGQGAELFAPDDLELPEADGQQDDERPERVARQGQAPADAGEVLGVDHDAGTSLALAKHLMAAGTPPAGAGGTGPPTVRRSR